MSSVIDALNVEFKNAFSIASKMKLISERAKSIISGVETNALYVPKTTSEPYRKARKYMGMHISIIKGIISKGYLSYEDCFQWAEACLFSCNIESAFELYDFAFKNMSDNLIDIYDYSWDKYIRIYEDLKGYRFDDIAKEISEDMFWIDFSKYGLEFAENNRLLIYGEDLDAYVNVEDRESIGDYY